MGRLGGRVTDPGRDPKAGYHRTRGRGCALRQPASPLAPSASRAGASSPRTPVDRIGGWPEPPQSDMRASPRYNAIEKRYQGSERGADAAEREGRNSAWVGLACWRVV